MILATTYIININWGEATAIATSLSVIGYILKWIGQQLIDHLKEVRKKSDEIFARQQNIEKELITNQVLILERMQNFQELTKDVHTKITNGGK